MAKVNFSDNAWDDFSYWLETDKKVVKQIQRLIKDISRNGNIGIGHPEQLKKNLSGYFSRHIDEKNRLVYRIENDVINIYSLRGHYNDK